MSEAKPIFIVGSGRSGTSIITGALKNGAGIEGYLEGHFLPLLFLFLKDIEKYFYSKRELMDDNRHMIADIDPSLIEHKIINIFRNQCESLHTGEVWLDKSPDSGMIKCVPYLVKVWEKSKFIFAKRRGIENLISRLKKFPHVSFEKHCIMWTDCMESWLKVRELVKDCSIEIEQREISLNPQKTANEIGSFLNLESEKIDKIATIFTTQRPQSTGSVEKAEALDINEIGWSDEEIKIFRKYCGDVSRKFGYSETSSYYL